MHWYKPNGHDAGWRKYHLSRELVSSTGSIREHRGSTGQQAFLLLWSLSLSKAHDEPRSLLNLPAELIEVLAARQKHFLFTRIASARDRRKSRIEIFEFPLFLSL